jgi:hypothetical protein
MTSRTDAVRTVGADTNASLSSYVANEKVPVNSVILSGGNIKINYDFILNNTIDSCLCLPIQ